MNINFIFIRTITKADLQNYISTHYSAPRIVLAAAGGVDHDQLTKLAEENFKGLKTTVSEEEKLKPCRFTGSEVKFDFQYKKKSIRYYEQCNTLRRICIWYTIPVGKIAKKAV